MSQFKVGDWVRHLINNNIFQLIRKDIIDNENYDLIYFNTYYDEEDCIHVFDGEIFQSEQYEHWQPKEGEWCWFWTNKGKILLGRLFKFESNAYYYDSPFCNMDINEVGIDRFKANYCEPFIGKLPSFLKDK